MSIFALRPKPMQLPINQLITLILTALSGCSLVQKNTSVCVLGILYKVHIGSNHAGSGKGRSAQGASQVEFLREGIFRCRAGVGGQGKPCGDGKPAGPDVPP